eukprot:350869-Chlamydomonas_euryale.AAC.3
MPAARQHGDCRAWWRWAWAVRCARIMPSRINAAVVGCGIADGSSRACLPESQAAFEMRRTWTGIKEVSAALCVLTA